ncbi:MAG: hypothetical protein ACK4SL_01335 [Candidatus Paceibacteria bacterium]
MKVIKEALMQFYKIIYLQAGEVQIGVLGLYVVNNESVGSFVRIDGHHSAGWTLSTVPSYFVGNDFALHDLRHKIQRNFGARLIVRYDYAANLDSRPRAEEEK